MGKRMGFKHGRNIHITIYDNLLNYPITMERMILGTERPSDVKHTITG